MVSLIKTIDTVVRCACGTEYVPQDARQTRCRPACRKGRHQIRGMRFVAVDGESLGRDITKYVLLGVGQEQIENPEGLNWRECIEFLYSRFTAERRKGGRVAFVGFYLGYDFIQMLKSLPEHRARLLFTEEGKVKRKHKVPGKEPHPVEYQGWQFDILGLKRLRIRPKRCACAYATCDCKDKAPWMFVSDVGGFFQQSFMSVIDPKKWNEPVVSDAEYAILETGKAHRNVAILDDEMRIYNRLENAILERVMDRLNRGFKDIGISLSAKQWFGPGQAAAKWLGKCVLPSRKWLKEKVPDYFLDTAAASYFGGWFEIMMHGKVSGNVYEYDINSAYPTVIEGLPCLEHGAYSRGDGNPGKNAKDSYLLVRARVWSTDAFAANGNRRSRIGTMLHRNAKGNISRPLLTEGWYWWHELEASKRAGLVSGITVYEWVKYVPCDCDKPFKSVRELYKTRLSVGKNTPLGMAAKLVYNSAYGKFAQSIGNPPFGNPVYASLITAGCRVMILDAIASHPKGQDAVAMVATDAVFFTEPHPGLKISSELGEWDETVKRNLTLFKPGVYWDDKAREDIAKGDDPRFKARGVNAKLFGKVLGQVDRQYGEWGTGGGNEWPAVTFKTDFAMVTCKQALARGKWELAGVNEAREAGGKELVQDSNPETKREEVWYDETMGVWRSWPHSPVWSDRLGDWDCVSHPYEKRFGMDDPFGEDAKEALGMTDDGTVSDMIRFVLKG